MAPGTLRYAMTARTASGACTLRYAERDLKMLGGPFLPEGSAFLAAAVVYDNFSVAHGQNAAAVTSKRAVDLRSAAERLLARLTRDHALLGRDYTFSVKPSRPRAGGGALAGLRLAEPLLPFDADTAVGVHAGPPGQIYLTLTVHAESGWHEAGTLDLRSSRPFQTDQGVVRVHKGPEQSIAWLSELPKLIALLPMSRTEPVELRHHFVGDAFDVENAGVLPKP